jgi:DNA-directed RNA polymerase subunit RPC12/RpoP
LETKKFSKNDDEFICENCGSKVERLGYTSRNHCPKCLYSKHVDINPGDRAETCHGMLEPVGIEINTKKGYIIVSRCKKCGSIRKNKAAEDDDIEKIITLSGNNK